MARLLFSINLLVVILNYVAPVLSEDNKLISVAMVSADVQLILLEKLSVIRYGQLVGRIIIFLPLFRWLNFNQLLTMKTENSRVRPLIFFFLVIPPRRQGAYPTLQKWSLRRSLLAFRIWTTDQREWNVHCQHTHPRHSPISLFRLERNASTPWASGWGRDTPISYPSRTIKTTSKSNPPT